MVNIERYTQYDLFEPKKSFGLCSCVTQQAIFHIESWFESNGRKGLNLSVFFSKNGSYGDIKHCRLIKMVLKHEL